jgi:hypothetical protein
MKKLAAGGLAALVLTATATNSARADTAVGLVFGYPGNVGLSLRFGPTPVNLAWSQDFLHGTVDVWALKTPLADDVGLSLYLGPGLDAGIPLDDAEEFFLAGRVPVGIQWMVTERAEVFGEVAPGLQFVDEVDFYWAANLGIRLVL